MVFATQFLLSDKSSNEQYIHSCTKEYDGARILTSLLLNMTSSLLHKLFEKVIMVILTLPPLWQAMESKLT